MLGAAAICLASSTIPCASGQGLQSFLDGIVEVEVGRGNNRAPEIGTGFVISADSSAVSVLTARHLFYDGRNSFTSDISVTFYRDRLHPHKAVWLVDFPNLDLAAITVESKDVPASVSQNLPTFSVRPDTAKLSFEDALRAFGGKSEAWQAPKIEISGLEDGDRPDRFTFTGNGIRKGFSGAPILDSSGRLAAVHLGEVPEDPDYLHAQWMAYAYPILSKGGVAMNKVSFSVVPVNGPPVNPEPSAALTLTRQPGSMRDTTDRGDLPYVWIPPGTFTMGCSEGDSACYGDEKPPHRVTITKGFWMGQTPVTVGAWKKYREAHTEVAALPTKDSDGRTNLNEASGDDSMPAVATTWDEAKGYCGWAGNGFRLPTEAEWEYAARAGTTGARYGVLGDIAWYGDNSGRKTIKSDELWGTGTDIAGYNKRLYENGNGPHPVGQKQKNAWNLYDMLGNVRQWVADWYGAKYYRPEAMTDPPGPPAPEAAGEKLHALRGGSWVNDARLVRVSCRGRYRPDDRDDSIGFRCVGE
jgi:formylglycine-generating enzyme required for sulfatase activity